ncbi:MAG: FAD-dependent oxidoreductase [Planctomycetes bacterium]|nr:FAD-dependent oxidoreductase [Planctomycetota bacterium]
MNGTHERQTDVLVLGGGFAGTRCAARLEKLLPKDRQITLLSSENYFVFQPLLPEVVGAALAPTHVVCPLRHLLRRTHIVRGDITAIELAPQDAAFAGTAVLAVEGLDAPVRIRADHLVVALGSVVDVTRIPGMTEHALQMKDVADALTLRHTILTRLERAAVVDDEAEQKALLTFVVVGGGFSGVETAAEIHDLVHGAMKFYPTLRDRPRKVVCVHSHQQILPELDERLGAHALKVLSKRGVEFRLGERTRAASREGVHLQSGALIPCRTIVCTVGNAPHPVLAPLADDKGRLVADGNLRALGRERVWAIGDCARIPDGRGGISPPTAQFATRQGDVAADNIAAALAGRALKEFRHKSQGQLATLGHQNAVAALGRLRVTGFLAWWMWRTIYLAKLPRFDRKLRVVLDWTLNLFFPRELTAMSTATHGDQPTIHLEAGEKLFDQGDPSTAFYLVHSGQIELTRCDKDGKVCGTDRLGPGEHFGEGSLLRSKVRTTTAVAVEPSTVLSFPARQFRALTDNFKGLRSLLEATSRRFSPADSIVPAWVPAERLQMPVSSLMTPDVVTLRPDATLRDALTSFLGRGVNSFPLTDDDFRLVGIVTSTDLFGALRRDVDLEQRIFTFCTTRVQCVSHDAPVARAIEIMRRRDVKHVVVTDANERVVGIVSIKDVLAKVLTIDLAARR